MDNTPIDNTIPAWKKGHDRGATSGWPIGRRYHGGYQLIDSELAQAYAAATNDKSDAYWEPDAIVPPMFHVSLFIDVMREIAMDPDLQIDFLHLVHGAHDATFFQPLRPGDLVQLRAILESVDEKPTGRVITSRLFGTVDGELVIEARTSYFVRDPNASTGEGNAKRPKPTTARPDPDGEISWNVAADQSHRYAVVSKDNNPIHTDIAVAKAAGFPDVVLHGLCTQAMSGRSILDMTVFGDPRRLRRLAVRFARPVFNGDTLTTKIWQKGLETHFVVENSAGEAVITHGVAIIES